MPSILPGRNGAGLKVKRNPAKYDIYNNFFFCSNLIDLQNIRLSQRILPT